MLLACGRERSLPSTTSVAFHPMCARRRARLCSSALSPPHLRTSLSQVVWGWLSDRKGRKAVLTVQVCGTAVALVGFGLSGSLVEALCWRTFGGAFSGIGGVCKAALREMIVESQRGRAFSLLGWSWSIGMFVGPMSAPRPNSKPEIRTRHLAGAQMSIARSKRLLCPLPTTVGGLLSRPADTIPALRGTIWDSRPYLLPCVASTFFCALGVVSMRRLQAPSSPAATSATSGAAVESSGDVTSEAVAKKAAEKAVATGDAEAGNVAAVTVGNESTAGTIAVGGPPFKVVDEFPTAPAHNGEGDAAVLLNSSHSKLRCGWPRCRTLLVRCSGCCGCGGNSRLSRCCSRCSVMLVAARSRLFVMVYVQGFLYMHALLAPEPSTRAWPQPRLLLTWSLTCGHWTLARVLAGTLALADRGCRLMADVGALPSFA